MTVRMSVVLALAVVLTACADVTFKRGAGPGAMAADERSCRASAPNDADYAACMRERGWLVSLSGEDAATSRAADRWLEAQDEETAAVTKPPAASAAPGSAPGAAAFSATGDDEMATATAAPVAAGVAAAPVFDPLAEATVASWWKLGGSAAALDGAIADCVADLGVAHRPDPGARRVTVGLRACLRAAGWFAVGL